VIYADKDDNIAMLGNGLFPTGRDRNLEWKNVILRGDTSALVWEPDFFPIDSLVYYENPKCGWLYNCNNSPFSATCEENDAVYSDYNPTLGYLIGQTNRATRTTELMANKEEITYEQIKKIKYDRSYSKCVESPVIADLEDIFNVDPQKYPDLEKVMAMLNDWDRTASLESRAAGFMSVAVKYVEDYVRDEALVPGPLALGEEAYASILRNDIPLADIQRHVRGEVDLPCAGLPDVLAATYVDFGKGKHKGKMIVKSGESYICLAQWKNGQQHIETVNCYGASGHEDSPHYTDQMEMFTRQQLKPMTLDKETIYNNAERIYHPQ
jgi:acyl-homoserine-lactone acylase